MPSISSDPGLPSRWSYTLDQLGELPEDRRPTAAPPPPTTCSGEDCAAEVPAQWVPPHRAQADGYWIDGGPCPACRAREAETRYRRKLGELVDASGIPDRYAWANWDRHVKHRAGEAWADFRDRIDAETAAQGRPVMGITAWNAPAAVVARAWRPGPKVKPTPRVLYLTGPVGSGKTTMAAAAAMAVLRDLARSESSDGDRYRVTWIAAGDLWEILRLEASSKARERGALARWAGADVLVVDDLGTLEAVKDWHRDAIEFLICNRYNADRPTLITSNLRLDSVDPTEPTIASLYGERVVSRLVEGMGGRRRGTPPGYLELLGMDWRADVPHPAPDPARPPSPSSSPATAPAAPPAAQRPLFPDYKRRAAGDED